MKKLLAIAVSLIAGKAVADCTGLTLSTLQDRQIQAGYSAPRLTQWSDTDLPMTAVTVVIHGLNLRPEKMDQYVRELNQLGHKVLRVTLRGHGENFAEFYMVSDKDWQSDFHDAFCIARDVSSEGKVPLNILTYSTGGPVTALAMVTHPDLYNFAKAVHIAPAFELNPKIKPIRLLLPFGWFSLRSLNIPEYKVHTYTPMRGYRALISTIDKIGLSGAYRQVLDFSTLVIVDPNDELVNVESIIAAAKKYNSWKTVWADGSASKGKIIAPHHSLIDSHLVGEKNWQAMQKEIKTFLE